MGLGFAVNPLCDIEEVGAMHGHDEADGLIGPVVKAC